MFQYFETFNRVKKVANFSIATSEIYRDSNGEKQSETTWHRLVARGKQADIVENYLKKGSENVIAEYCTPVF
jgi:single stranded DNA-binding protein